MAAVRRPGPRPRAVETALLVNIPTAPIHLTVVRTDTVRILLRSRSAGQPIWPTLPASSEGLALGQDVHHSTLFSTAQPASGPRAVAPPVAGAPQMTCRAVLKTETRSHLDPACPSGTVNSGDLSSGLPGHKPFIFQIEMWLPIGGSRFSWNESGLESSRRRISLEATGLPSASQTTRDSI